MPLVKSLFRFFFVALAFIALGVVCSVNTDPVVVNVPFAQPIQTPMAIVVLVIFMFGVTTVVLQFGMDVIRKNLEIRRLNKQIEKLEESQSSSSGSSNDPKILSSNTEESNSKREALATD